MQKEFIRKTNFEAKNKFINGVFLIVYGDL